MQSSHNILPHDGHAEIIHPIGTEPNTFHKLHREIEWRQDEVVMFGKRLTLRRLSAWYGDKPFEYIYSKVSHKALPWSRTLTEIKTRVEELTLETYNSCLLNYYHDGEDSMGWHSDDEPELNPSASIASVSLGAERKFAFKHKKSKETVSVFLPDRSLLLMKPPTQENWLHTLRKSRKVDEPRINLTFRTILVQE
jgi:alkylated DNA repair dioxygenase AlkB